MHVLCGGAAAYSLCLFGLFCFICFGRDRHKRLIFLVGKRRQYVVAVFNYMFYCGCFFYSHRFVCNVVRASGAYAVFVAALMRVGFSSLSSLLDAFICNCICVFATSYTDNKNVSELISVRINTRYCDGIDTFFFPFSLLAVEYRKREARLPAACLRQRPLSLERKDGAREAGDVVTAAAFPSVPSLSPYPSISFPSSSFSPNDKFILLGSAFDRGSILLPLILLTRRRASWERLKLH